MVKENEQLLERATHSNAGSNRDALTYLDMFELTFDELGDSILDLGSANAQLFARQVEKYSDGKKKVVSLNPTLLNKSAAEDMRTPREGLPPSKDSVIALSHALPFVDEQFDTIVALHSVPQFLEDNGAMRETGRRRMNKELLLQTLQEAVRVLQVGGKAYFLPVRMYNKETKQLYKEVIATIRKEQFAKGITINFQLDASPDQDSQGNRYKMTVTKELKKDGDDAPPKFMERVRLFFSGGI